MEDLVTVSTGVTYERRSIERWFFKYDKTTCPATMQCLASFDLTPNHTLKRIISTWRDRASSPSSPTDTLAPPPLSENASVDLVLKPECMRPMVALVQRGSAEARLHAMSILDKVSKASGGRNWAAVVDVEDMVKSLLDLLSDGASSKLSSRALDIDVTACSPSSGRARRGKDVVEVGPVRVLVELLPDADRHVTERTLLLLKRLCKCPEGCGSRSRSTGSPWRPCRGRFCVCPGSPWRTASTTTRSPRRARVPRHKVEHLPGVTWPAPRQRERSSFWTATATFSATAVERAGEGNDDGAVAEDIPALARGERRGQPGAVCGRR
ncbi:hypothetical protein QYE76_006648 [Lolium multiflorum]|uniref:U-box domain-containing protein n=1 Tax=Lolium multiflorum TaxID=4521 RepID=A0AAD8RW73_LOLMU|nr:hypothetical protein QYE76_006648 [Lolium multiflorum]